jgi:hypothetical protein
MRTKLVFLGLHIDLASQIRRRWLVALLYAGFAALMVAGWFLDHWRVWGAGLTLFAASYVARLVLGGFGPGGTGVIKPFLGNEVRARYISSPESRWSRLARRTIPQITEEREFCSDERELSRRDSAHEVAYRRLGMLIIVTLLVAYFKNAALPLLRGSGITLPSAFFDQSIYGLLLASFILFLTLPQSILLWTEPDMETPNES